jgi:hypothetical protein
MSWETPKMDWATNYGIGTADFNRIEGNINILKIGGDPGADIYASASTFVLPAVKNFHKLTNNNEIKFISTVGWAAGAIITLAFQQTSGSNTTLWHNAGSAPANSNPLWFYLNAANQFASAGMTLSFVFDGDYWRCLGAKIG